MAMAIALSPTILAAPLPDGAYGTPANVHIENCDENGLPIGPMGVAGDTAAAPSMSPDSSALAVNSGPPPNVHIENCDENGIPLNPMSVAGDSASAPDPLQPGLPQSGLPQPGPPQPDPLQPGPPQSGPPQSGPPQQGPPDLAINSGNPVIFDPDCAPGVGGDTIGLQSPMPPHVPAPPIVFDPNCEQGGAYGPVPGMGQLAVKSNPPLPSGPPPNVGGDTIAVQSPPPPVAFDPACDGYGIAGDAIGLPPVPISAPPIAFDPNCNDNGYGINSAAAAGPPTGNGIGTQTAGYPPGSGAGGDTINTQAAKIPEKGGVGGDTVSTQVAGDTVGTQSLPPVFDENCDDNNGIQMAGYAPPPLVPAYAPPPIGLMGSTDAALPTQGAPKMSVGAPLAGSGASDTTGALSPGFAITSDNSTETAPAPGAVAAAVVKTPLSTESLTAVSNKLSSYSGTGVGVADAAAPLHNSASSMTFRSATFGIAIATALTLLFF